jgi:hypothetical protein
MSLIQTEPLQLVARLKLTVPQTVGIPDRAQPKGSIIYNKLNDRLYVSDGTIWEYLTPGGITSLTAGVGIDFTGTTEDPIVNAKVLASADSSITSTIVGTDINAVVDDVNTYEQYFNAFSPDTAEEKTLFPPFIGKYLGGVYVPSSGKIYLIPGSVTHVAIIDPGTDTVDITTIVGIPAGNDKWFGGVLAPNGKIYCPPLSGSTAVLIIDTNTNTFNTTSITGLTGSLKWSGAVLAPNGKIYCQPWNESRVLIIDSADDTATFITGLGTDDSKWGSGSLAPNGKIYYPPYFESTAVLVVDPSTDTASQFGTFPGNFKWISSAFSPNTGKIYGIPDCATDIICIDPATDTAQLLGLSLTNILKWWGGNLAPNGKIYMIPFEDPAVGILDPVTNTVDTTSITGLGTNEKWVGGVLAPNGKVYAAPRFSPDLLIISTGPPADFTSGINHDGINMRVPFEFCISRYFNKF